MTIGGTVLSSLLVIISLFVQRLMDCFNDILINLLTGSKSSWTCHNYYNFTNNYFLLDVLFSED